MSWPNRGLAHRPVVMGVRGVVASASPLASRAGVSMLEQGGHAVDAAVATASVLALAEPYMSGAGGCGYMMIWDEKQRTLRVLDYVGPSPAAATLAAFEQESDKDHGPKSPLVPSACAGWMVAHNEYGRLSREVVFEPAIGYAFDGVPLTVKNGEFYRLAYGKGHLTAETQSVFMPGGSVPNSGAIIKQPLLGTTYQTIAKEGHEPFYRGALAKRIVDSVQKQGGLLSGDDLAAYNPVWKKPISTEYRGYTVNCPPPPCAGIQYLQTLAMLDADDLPKMGQNQPDTIHLMAEAMKRSVADRIAFAANPRLDGFAMLQHDYISERRSSISADVAAKSEGERYSGPRGSDVIAPGDPDRLLRECTTHFDVVDQDGNAVAVTQSLGDGFGSGVMAGDTGLMLNNFGYWFDFDPDSPNVIGPGKHIEMCMAPATVTRDDSLFAVIGTPGSFGILETTPQMISNIIDHGFSVQAAIEAPRFKTLENTVIEVEARIPKSTRDDLTARGHQVRLLDDWSPMVGGGQGIVVDPETGVRMGGADPRRDGYAIGW